MSLNADFIYNDDWHDVSNRVDIKDIPLEQLLELHKMLCDIMYKEQMDLETFASTVYEETISSVKKAIKAMKSNLEVCPTTNHSSPRKGLFVEVWYDGSY